MAALGDQRLDQLGARSLVLDQHLGRIEQVLLLAHRALSIRAVVGINREQLIQRRIRDSEMARRRIGEPERAAYGSAARAYDARDCNAGDQRYNHGPGIDSGTGAQALLSNADKTTACHACHGQGAQFLSVQHTPLQTGGFTDDDLQNVFTNGYKPDGSVFVTPFPPQIYQMFHKWSVTEQEKVGLVCYMRSIAPASMGMLDFQGPAPKSTPSNVPCGSVVCSNTPDPQRQTVPGTTLAPACCADAANSVCGRVSSSNGTCAPRPAPAAQCPMALGSPGCCAGANLCGVDAWPEGMGCVETSGFKASINTLLLPGLMLPESAHCDGTPWGSQDAGR